MKKMKSFVQGRDVIARLVNEFAENVEILDIQTHLASDQQIIALVIYEEKENGDGRRE